MNFNASVQRIPSRIQCFHSLGGRELNTTCFRHPRLQLPSSTLSNPTINTFRIHRYSTTSGVPSIEICPCESDLTAPDLRTDEVDKKSPLAGVITRHYRHVLVHTGTIDWPSRIEQGPSIASKLKSIVSRSNGAEEETSVTAKLKALVSRGSIYVDPFYPVLVTNTSLPTDPTAKDGHATITVFPDAIELTSVPNSRESLESVVTSLLLPPSNPLSSTRKAGEPFTTRKISKPVILTCSHGNRDKRCGILGPAITKSFKQALDKSSENGGIDCIVGDISHIGGHKFAGNVIIHLPGDHPLSKAVNEAPASSLPISEPEDVVNTDISGHSVSIWYGRVMPYHVEGIIETTLRQGKIVKELLRGIVNSHGDLVDLRAIGLK
ncbi:hypothetical protein TWF281_008713 [Arthrobotrys megalospora]